MMRSSANELQQNSNASSREDYIHSSILLEIHCVNFIFDLCGLLSFVCHKYVNNS